MPTNFDLAPPGKTVDGLAAVPVDIQHIAAALVFDAATSSGTGDATLDFIVSPAGGCPIFDLRQPITGVWLDGAPLAPVNVASHDFGGEAGAGLRVLDVPLAAGSAHNLRFTYNLGPPQASTAGSYQPAIAWSAGPRLRFNFGFTDLGPGRYLESWVPANLIFDQFDLTLELRVLNTAVAHDVITNGSVTMVAANHWSVSFPTRSTAFTPLVEVRAADTVMSQTGSVTLPMSGTTVAIEAWKLVGSAVDLAARIADLATWMAANETSTGPYLHGNRFVAFLNVGGMEYDGGTTTGVGALRHEAFHSWWGRGLKPASQRDAWSDEAWTVYNENGATGSMPFDFAAPPVQLCSRNPWIRTTPSASYNSGDRFFRGAASLMGVANLTSHMANFYTERNARPATTTQLEEHLISRAGEATLVDAFHRFVYGFADPSPAPDLWIKDNPGDPGSNQWAGTFWNSPDLWIRHADDGGTTHQPVEYGQDNWFHARVRNRSATGTARHFVVTFNVKPWAGMQFVYPGDFLPCMAAVADFELGPGETRVVRARWPAALVPPGGTHACWLAAVLSRADHPAAGSHVWEHNNLAQKNLVVVDAVPHDWVIVPFLIDRVPTGRPRRVTLRLARPNRGPRLEAVLLHDDPGVFEVKARSVPGLIDATAGKLAVGAKSRESLDCGGAQHARRRKPEVVTPLLGVSFGAKGIGGGLGVRLRLPGRGQLLMRLAVRVPGGVRAGDELPIDLLEWDERRSRVIGGIAVSLRIKRAKYK